MKLLLTTKRIDSDLMTPRSKIVGVYGLRWKFMQIQTQQVRIFRIFSAIHSRPPFLCKTYMATVNCKTNNIPFFCHSRKRKLGRVTTTKLEKTFLKIYGNIVFSLKESKVEITCLDLYFCPYTITYRTLRFIYLLQKNVFNSSTKMSYYILTTLSQLSMSSFQITNMAKFSMYTNPQ